MGSTAVIQSPNASRSSCVPLAHCRRRTGIPGLLMFPQWRLFAVDAATTAELRLDVPRSEGSSPIVRHDTVSMSKWVTILVTADIAGAALIAVCVFGLYASPRDYDRAQLWEGLASFLVGWIMA